MSVFGRDKTRMPSPEEALPGRDRPVTVPETHFVNGHPLEPPFPDGLATARFGLGCFWGAERAFWQVNGVYSTAVGYAGGSTPNPTYEEVCSGRTGHNEVVQVWFDPSVVSYDQLLKVFWEHHDPTQGMRQGNDVGTQYRSGIYAFDDEQRDVAIASRARPTRRCCARPVTGTSQPRSCPRGPFTTPRTTTSSTWRRIPAAIAAWAAPA